MPKQKSCITCNEVKPLTEFHRDKSKKDGRRPYCRACRNKKLKTNIKHTNKILSKQQERKCMHCEKIKPINEFNKNSSTNDGVSNTCKDCQSAYKSQYYEDNKGKIAKYQKRYYNTLHGKQVRRKKQVRDLDNPVIRNRMRARGAVNDAVRYGKMKRASDFVCTFCNNPASEYHHYLGYDRKNWLKVIPVCRKCHTS